MKGYKYPQGRSFTQRGTRDRMIHYVAHCILNARTPSRKHLMSLLSLSHLTWEEKAFFERSIDEAINTPQRSLIYNAARLKADHLKARRQAAIDQEKKILINRRDLSASYEDMIKEKKAAKRKGNKTRWEPLIWWSIGALFVISCIVAW